MLKDFTQLTTMTANSYVNGEIALAMRATLSEEDSWNISKTIRNSSLYLANKETCEQDYEEFEARVLTVAQAS